MTADERIPELLARIDLEELVGRLGAVEAKRSGGTTTFRCPAPGHEDRTPSFTVKEGRWRCWSACARSGDAIDLVVWLQGCTTAEAIEQLAAGAGLERRSERPVPPTVTRWCAGRGWGPHVVGELGLTMVKDRFGRPRIRFPFRLEGAVAYYQDRRLDDSPKYKYLSPDGGRAIPYEADRMRLAKERGHVFIVEGVTDVVALVDVYTSPAVVGIPGADAWRPSWAPAFGGLVVFVVADNDTAGQAFRAKVAGDLQCVARSVEHLFVPSACNDIASWRQGLDVEEFDAQFMAAADATTSGPIRMAG